MTWDFSEVSLKRFWAKVQKTPTCWIWTASVAAGGYGQMTREGKNCKAHKFSYVYHKGETNGLHVLHRCDNPRCVNPDHLFLGTPRDNNLDCIGKGRRGKSGATGAGNGAVKVKDIPVREILEMYEQGTPAYEIGPLFGLGKSTINNIVKGRHWANGIPAKRKFGRAFSERRKTEGHPSGLQGQS